MCNKILFKLPSRERPNRVFEVLDETVKHLKDKENFLFLLTLDEDDITMNNEEVKSKLSTYPNMNYIFGKSNSKIDAVNRDLNNFQEEWDILVLLSDDMIPIYPGFDEIIRINFNDNFPDFDGVTWFNDGYQKHNLNTLCILGKKYYNRFNYIYHPSYKSFYCDDEFTDVANKLNKQIYVDTVIIEHRHYTIINHNERYDELYVKNGISVTADSK